MPYPKLFIVIAKPRPKSGLLLFILILFFYLPLSLSVSKDFHTTEINIPNFIGFYKYFGGTGISLKFNFLVFLFKQFYQLYWSRTSNTHTISSFLPQHKGILQVLASLWSHWAKWLLRASRKMSKVMLPLLSQVI